MAGTFAVLIGKDTKTKERYVGWKIEVAIEKGCRLIGVNLDGGRRYDSRTCPDALVDAGTIFVPFSAKAIAYALENYKKNVAGSFYYPDELYSRL